MVKFGSRRRVDMVDQGWKNTGCRCWGRLGQMECTYFVMMPVVETPSVLCVTRNMPFSFIGL